MYGQFHQPTLFQLSLLIHSLVHNCLIIASSGTCHNHELVDAHTEKSQLESHYDQIVCKYFTDWLKGSKPGNPICHNHKIPDQSISQRPWQTSIHFYSLLQLGITWVGSWNLDEFRSGKSATFGMRKCEKGN